MSEQELQPATVRAAGGAAGADRPDGEAGGVRGGGSGGVMLTDVRDVALSVDEVMAAVRHPGAGGVAVFVGVVREHDHGHDVSALDYTSHPTAADVLRRVAEQVGQQFAGVRLAAVHRTGHLEVGDLAVVVAASAAHRGEAFSACRLLIDTLKAEVPIWKEQLFADGSQEWVGSP